MTDFKANGKLSRTFPNSINWDYQDLRFLVFSEYAMRNHGDYAKIATDSKKYVIGGSLETHRISVSLYSPDGELLGKRDKTHLFPSEKDGVRQEGDRIFPFEFVANGKKLTLLPILCYELLFPEDWIDSKFKPDFITHHIGFPMFDAVQDEDWFSMQKVLALRFKCDVVVSCGKTELSLWENMINKMEPGIDNSGVVYYGSGRPERILLDSKRA